MKIFDFKSTFGLNPLAGTGPSRTGAASQRPAKPEAASDQVQLSSLSFYLTSAQDGSPAHAAKVGALGSAVASGQYQVDVHAVSGSIIQHAIEFGRGSYQGISS